MTDTERRIEVLQPGLDAIRRNFADVRQQVSTDDKIGAFFVERLDLALESTVGYIVLAKADLAYPVAILPRSMLELTMTTFWAASTPERAIEASSANAAR